IRFDSVRSGEWRDEKVSERRRIILSGSAAGTGTHAATAARADARSDTATTAWSRARGTRVADAPLPGVRRNRRIHRRRRSNGRFNLWFGFRLLYRWNRQRLRLGHHSRIRSDAHEFEM